MTRKMRTKKTSIEKVREYFKTKIIYERIQKFEMSSATVVLAAKALRCDENHIAKTLSFHVGEKVVLIVAAGDAMIDNSKYKAQFVKKLPDGNVTPCPSIMRGISFISTFVVI